MPGEIGDDKPVIQQMIKVEGDKVMTPAVSIGAHRTWLRLLGMASFSEMWLSELL